MRPHALCRFILAGATLGLGSVASADVVPHGGMMRFPDVSESHIAFVYANDIWIVPREGGEARPLASPPGPELFPRFSPDGRTIAFVGNYDGNRDLYTIPVGGGIPVRVTHHPANEQLEDWTPDGRLLFSSNGFAGLGRQQQMFIVDAAGGLPEKLPIPYGSAGAVSPDGTWIAYTPYNADFRTWKRYRGGLASDIWLFNLKTMESRRVTTWEGTDTQPMWHGDKLYYLSDEGTESRLNIWVYDLASRRHEQVTRFEEFDVKWPAIGPGTDGRGEIVFQLGSELRLLDLQTRQSRIVNVRIPGDRPQLRPQAIDASDFMQQMAISPTGKRAVISARGDIWTTPAEHGAPRNLTRTNGIAERDPSWSPDGRWIAFFADTTGDYELYITQSDGLGETRQLTTDSRTYYYTPRWSPDSKHIAFMDKSGRMLLASIESGDVKTFDQDPWGYQRGLNWSHDSRWIAYAKGHEQNPHSSVHLYDTINDVSHQVTAPMFDDHSPVFDREGDWLYFASDRNFTPTYSGVDTTFIYNNTQVLLAVPLRKDVKSPWLAKSDEETWKSDAAKEPEEKPASPADEPKPDDGLSGAWSGTGSHPEAGGELPFTLNLQLGENNTVTGNLDAGIYSGAVNGTFDKSAGRLTLTLVIGDGSTVLFELIVKGEELTGTASSGGTVVRIAAKRLATANGAQPEAKGDASKDSAAKRVEIDLDGFERRAMLLPVPPGAFGRLAVNDRNQLIYARQSGGGSSGIKLFDLKDSVRTEKDVAGGSGFDISADGKHLLIARGKNSVIHPAATGGSPKTIKTDDMTVMVDPRVEWKQLFTDAWRIQRDFFYVTNMHDMDWDAMRLRYERMLADCVNREDVSYVISELISELNVGHAYYWGGDVESQPNVTVGMLGVDFSLENGAYRLAKKYHGADWDADARGPLNQPGVDVHEGDYLLAVNGIPLDVSRDPWAAFIGKVGKVVTLTVSTTPVMDDSARHVLVEPISSEADLRYRAWIERNRRYVEEQTDGKVGYVYVPDTGVNGQNNLFRQFYGQTHAQALIIDERWNGGGQIPTRFIELLNRPVTNYWARSNGKDWKWPPDSHQGPKCMLINGPAGSGGDAFPYYFRQSGLGKLIGTRTWGGLVGISGNPTLIDGGYTAVPTFGFYENDGTWGIEGHGVDPDMEVIDDPALMWEGGDPQLDAAIRHMLDEIQRIPYVAPPQPPAPDRRRMGITEDDK